MDSYCMIETASDSKEEIKKIATILLEKKLIASAHIINSSSSWNWDGKLEEDSEYLLQMKTKSNYLNEIYNIIKRIHSYECFEFAVYKIDSNNKDYLKWIDTETANG